MDGYSHKPRRAWSFQKLEEARKHSLMKREWGRGSGDEEGGKKALSDNPEAVGKRVVPDYILGGNVIWYNHYGKQCGVSSKN